MAGIVLDLDSSFSHFRTATDTVISVEEDPEIEALSAQPLAMPPDSTHSRAARQRRNDHTHIDLEQGHDIPGLVTTPEVWRSIMPCKYIVTSVVSIIFKIQTPTEDHYILVRFTHVHTHTHTHTHTHVPYTCTQVEYKGVVKEGGATSVVSVVLEEVGREEREAESSPLQENVSHSSEASTTSYSSTKELLTKY